MHWSTMHMRVCACVCGCVCGHPVHIDISPNTAGIGPWKVAMLSAVLMLWDIMWWAHVPINSQDWIIKVCGSLTYHMFV